MPQSMTAFARATQETEWGTLAWEIRSVNHRYLEAAFRLPETFREVEMPAREALRTALGRGKLDCSLQFIPNRAEQAVAVNRDKAADYLRAANEIAALMDNPAPLSPLEILDRPGVLEERQLDMESIKTSASALFRTAVEQLIANRAIEGEKLARFLRQRLTAIATETTRVRARLPEILDAQRQRLIDKIAGLDITLDADRLEQEIVMIAQKADVDEELDRLDAHLEEIEAVLKRKEPIGRRLDFLMQELNREANTLSSKSLATDTTQSAVELKVLIEQMREQIQNIE